jgi:hypothetical protein
MLTMTIIEPVLSKVEGKNEALHSRMTFYEAVKLKKRSITPYGAFFNMTRRKIVIRYSENNP